MIQFVSLQQIQKRTYVFKITASGLDAKFKIAGVVPNSAKPYFPVL